MLELSVPPEAAGLRLDVYLSSAEHGLPFSRSQLGRRITAGEVLLDGNPSRPGYRLRPGQRIVFTPAQDQPPGDHPEAIPLEILFDDRHLIVLNKPAGMVVHPAPGHETCTLVNALLHHCGALPMPPAYTPPTSGSASAADD